MDDSLVERFRERGCIVAKSVLSPDAVAACREGLHADLLSLGIDHDAVEIAAGSAAMGSIPAVSAAVQTALRRAQSHQTGALPLPFSPWRLEHCATNARLFALHQRLWRLYANPRSSDSAFVSPRAGTFDPASGKGWALLDAVGYRIPSVVSSKAQRGLGMHLDLSPWQPWHDFELKADWRLQQDPEAHTGSPAAAAPTRTSWKFWRPIQCFIALTPGRFECCAGVHAAWDALLGAGETSMLRGVKPYRGRFYSLHPWTKRFAPRLEPYRTSIAFDAGDAVLWDSRTPHCVGERLPGAKTREVIYTAFLPPTFQNEEYGHEQARCLTRGVFPPSQAFGISPIVRGGDVPGWVEGAEETLSPFARALIGYV